VDQLSNQLADLVRRGEGNSPQAKAIAQKLNDKLNELKNKIQTALLQRVVEDFVDINTPLKQFTDAVLAPEGCFLPFSISFCRFISFVFLMGL
jgi:vinculin